MCARLCQVTRYAVASAHFAILDYRHCTEPFRHARLAALVGIEACNIAGHKEVTMSGEYTLVAPDRQ
jgi:hypothetical protein